MSWRGSDSRFRHTRRGVVVSLPAEERKAVSTVVEQFRQLLFSGSDPNLTRLEPMACPDDPETELEYREMAGTRLLQSRLEAIDVVEEGLGGTVLDEEAVAAWMQTLNGIRLYLGERLEITTDGKDEEELPPDSPKHRLVNVYRWLGGLLQELVDAAEEGLPRGQDGE